MLSKSRGGSVVKTPHLTFDYEPAAYFTLNGHFFLEFFIENAEIT